MEIVLIITLIVFVALCFYRLNFKINELTGRINANEADTLKKLSDGTNTIQRLIDLRSSQTVGKINNMSLSTYRQLRAAQDIDRMVGDDISRNLRGWAISPDALVSILRYIKGYKPKAIVELGGGYSTVAINRLIERESIDCKIISVDHNSDYLEQTRGLVGSSKNVIYVEAPLKKYGKYKWYDTSKIKQALGSVKIDLLVVDGPPESTNRRARQPAHELLKDMFAKKYTIILDDASRDDEKAAVDKWLKDDTDLKHTYIYAEKGLSILSSVEKILPHKIL